MFEDSSDDDLFEDALDVATWELTQDTSDGEMIQDAHDWEESRNSKLRESLMEKFSSVRPDVQELFTDVCMRKMKEMRSGWSERVEEDAQQMFDIVKKLYDKDVKEYRQEMLVRALFELGHWGRYVLRLRGLLPEKT